MDTLASQMQKMRQSASAATPLNSNTLSLGTTMDQRIAQALREDYRRTIEAWPDAPVCPYCGGMGNITLNITNPEHPAFGRAFKCPCRESWNSNADIWDTERALTRLFKGNAIPESHQHLSFASFDELSAEMLAPKRLALRACRSLVKNGFIQMQDGTKKYGIVLSGLVGVGKTALASASAIEMAVTGKPVLFMDFSDLIDDIQATYDSDYKGPTKKQLVDAAGQAKVLFLDDVAGCEDDDRVSRDERKNMYKIIRQRHAKSAVTFFTTNLDKKRFRREFGARINRRVRHLCLWVDVGGDDLTPYGQEL